MQNFSIKNQADESVDIEVLGTIGEDWFGEGVTMQDTLKILKSITAKKINLRIASLGGDIEHALAIYNIIKLHPAQVNSQIIGLTASAGTIVAMAGDTVEMSSKSMFLIHNSLTYAIGNANELRDVAEVLDKFDGLIAGVYHTKTGKRKSQIMQLMEEERWLSPEEAKDFGLVDKIFEPQTNYNYSKIINEINNSGKLPKIITNMKEEEKRSIINEVIEKVTAIFKPKIQNQSDPAQKNENMGYTPVRSYDTQISCISQGVSVLLTDEVENAINESVDSAVAKHEGEITERDQKITNLEKTINDLKAEKDKITNEFRVYAEAKLDKAKVQELSGDPAPDIKDKKEGETFFDSFAKRIRNDMKFPEDRDEFINVKE
jgi:ATP-dependent protease ClpP protease subunit